MSGVLERARRVAARVTDPELPMLTIEDLGILREVRLDGAEVEVDITPSYTACPAIGVIAIEIGLALERAGIRHYRVRTVLSPAWSSDWLSETARRKLRACGIAAPSGDHEEPAEAIDCPRCGGRETRLIAAFGSTACKALHQCDRCLEPFECFKRL